MGVFAWCTRRLGGLSMIALVILSYYVITSESNLERHGYKFEHPDKKSMSYSSTSTSGAGIWTYIFAYYCLLVHCLVFTFPMRACWSIWDIIKCTRRHARGIALKDYKLSSVRRRGSYASVSSSETLTSEHIISTATSSEAGDFEPHMYTDAEELTSASVVHAIVIPNYKEEMDTLKETLDVLASHPMARSSYDIYLGMEQREAEAETKALSLIQEFVKKFRSIDYTLHPSDILGEAAGKGSNMAWAARKLSEKYPLEQRKDVILTGIDSDSHLSSKYFTIATDMHLSFPETATTTLYAAPIIFDRNAHKVSVMVRVADILWTAAGMSGLYTGSVIAPPTSVYSMSLELVDRVGGWDTDAEAIGEDLHMYIKCFFATNGHLTCRTIMSPVSQSNVEAGSKGGIRGTFIDMKARYKQALRHMWGALDAGYALRQGIGMWNERKHTTRTFRPLHQMQGDETDNYIPDNHQLGSNDPETPRENGIFAEVTQETLKGPHLLNVFYVSHRMYEAHILPVHMSILVIASAIYMFVTDGNEDPNNLNWVFTTSNILRTVGFMLMGGYMFLYETFHQLCVENREAEMKAAGLADGMGFSYRSLKKNFCDYLVVPLVAPIYSSIPCIQAELSHFWTLNLVYTVTKKSIREQRQRARSFAVAAQMA